MDPIFSRIETAARTMARLAATPNLTAALLSNQMIQFCPHYHGKHNSQGIAFDVLPDLAAVIDEKRRYDLIVLCGHNAGEEDRKSTRLNSSHVSESRMPSSA